MTTPGQRRIRSTTPGRLWRHLGVASCTLRIPPVSHRCRRVADRAQSTVEYALILVAVTAMVGVVIAYVSGDGGGVITGLFGAAFARMRGMVGG
ncbi:MAG: DUF4244 domain-containing protein [Microthrixaceae bacterium]